MPYRRARRVRRVGRIPDSIVNRKSTIFCDNGKKCYYRKYQSAFNGINNIRLANGEDLATGILCDVCNKEIFGDTFRCWRKRCCHDTDGFDICYSCCVKQLKKRKEEKKS